MIAAFDTSYLNAVKKEESFVVNQSSVKAMNDFLQYKEWNKVTHSDVQEEQILAAIDYLKQEVDKEDGKVEKAIKVLSNTLDFFIHNHFYLFEADIKLLLTPFSKKKMIQAFINDANTGIKTYNRIKEKLDKYKSKAKKATEEILKIKKIKDWRSLQEIKKFQKEAEFVELLKKELFNEKLKTEQVLGEADKIALEGVGFEEICQQNPRRESKRKDSFERFLKIFLDLKEFKYSFKMKSKKRYIAFVRVLKEVNFIKKKYPLFYATCVYAALKKCITKIGGQSNNKKEERSVKVEINAGEIRNIKINKNFLPDMRIAVFLLPWVDEFVTCDKGQAKLLEIMFPEYKSKIRLVEAEENS
ncbi:MAG: hypothetical protein Q8Q56_00460 [Alphaproteobacteria bacterium]|nr:hypothetical protein [Alphaproteobacteria bacterium]